MIMIIMVISITRLCVDAQVSRLCPQLNSLPPPLSSSRSPSLRGGGRANDGDRR